MLDRLSPPGLAAAMRILVLGGTAWLGRTVAQEAVARGHDVTCAARGSAAPPRGVAFVVVDRDHEHGLAPLAGATWDAVVDVSRQPAHVRRAVRDLVTAHWVFVSTGSVYARFDAIEQPEESRRRPPLEGEVLVDMETYGEAKVACEDAVTASAATATIVRSGLIGGPGDVSGRTGYWPWRFAHPVAATAAGAHPVTVVGPAAVLPAVVGPDVPVPEVAVPDDLDFPCALIDVRDLAAWLVTAAEQRLDGPFNATGPTIPLGEVLATSAEVAGSSAYLRPVSAERLRTLGVQSWMGPASLPLWIDDPTWRGFATMDTRRARAHGLTTRLLEETLRDALAYEEVRVEPRRAGLTDDEEKRVLGALRGA